MNSKARDIAESGARRRTFRFRIRDLKLRRGYRLCLALASIIMVAGCAALIFAFNPEQDNVGGPIATHWQNNTTTWELNPDIGSNVNLSGGVTAETALKNAFSSWTGAQLNGQALTTVAVSEGPNAPTTMTDPESNDCVNIVSFVPSSSVSFPTGAIAFTQLSTVTGTPPSSYSCTSNGQTTTQTCNLKSCIVDADIVFNPKENFSTATPPLSGDFDVQAVATHEIGHMLGLDHSGIAGTIMDPFGDAGQSQERNLAIDDALGIGFLYPASGFSSATGVISGTVTQSSVGIFGAHVVAVNTATGVATVDGLTDTSGHYSLIAPPGTYNVLAIPMTGVYDITNFGGWYCGFSENSPPCCDSSTAPAGTCNGAEIKNPTNYTGKLFGG